MVTLWHWTLSVTTRRDDGQLVMPNPIAEVPAAEYVTWLFQVMPLFFLVAGYAALTSWQRASSRGVSSHRYVASRLRRLAVPTAGWASVWLAAELVVALRPGGHRWVWEWFPGYVVPLWFLGVYGILVVLSPLSARLHQRFGSRVLASLGGLLAVGEIGVRLGLGWAAWTNAAVVWIVVWQLGYQWRTWQVNGIGRTHRTQIALAGAAGLAILTGPGGYPVSLVATVGDTESNMFPTSPAIAAAAILQLGVVLLAAPAASRLLRRPAVWKPVIAINAYALTVFLWHMTAYLVVLWVYEGLGMTLRTAPDAAWWAQRPVWLFAPLAVMCALAAVFSRLEAAGRRTARR